MDGRWEVAQEKSIRPLSFPGTSCRRERRELRDFLGELLLRALHKHSGHFYLLFLFYRIGSFRRPMQVLAKLSLPKADASQGERELKISICTM